MPNPQKKNKSNRGKFVQECGVKNASSHIIDYQIMNEIYFFCGNSLNRNKVVLQNKPEAICQNCRKNKKVS
ncbi:MAG TPA: hypothetical protein PLP33_24930 [Leptospiraceae bacterium]|nr:hypothetical protein [Leptospiraceae bacterium]